MVNRNYQLSLSWALNNHSGRQDLPWIVHRTWRQPLIVQVITGHWRHGHMPGSHIDLWTPLQYMDIKLSSLTALSDCCLLSSINNMWINSILSSDLANQLYQVPMISFFLIFFSVVLVSAYFTPAGWCDHWPLITGPPGEHHQPGHTRVMHLSPFSARHCIYIIKSSLSPVSSLPSHSARLGFNVIAISRFLMLIRMIGSQHPWRNQEILLELWKKQWCLRRAS